jgi:D-3-phosphoglycerate dehydrogenase
VDLYAALPSITGKLELEYEGELAEHDVHLLTASAIRGLLAPFTEERINPVNAHLVAAAHGMRLVERRSPRLSGNYPNLLTMHVNRFHLAGTVLMDEPRVIRIDDFRVDLPTQGRFLVSRHTDQPGVVGRVGTILGEHDINIASMQVGRDAPRGSAMMILTVDDPVHDAVLESLRVVPGMSDLRYVELEPANNDG